MKHILLILMLLCASVINAESVYEKAHRADDYYRQGDYENALILYHDIERERVSFGLYYNLGNTYFKYGQFAKAKLYYLRAQRIRPSDNDVSHNLRSVEMRLTDAVKQQEHPKLIAFLLTVKNALSFNALLITSALIWLLSSLLWALMHHKVSKTVIGIAVVLSTVAFLITVVRVKEFRERSYILTAPEVRATSEPLDSSSTIFTIHAGVEFSIREKADNWYLIVLKNGFRGWIKIDTEPIFEKI